MINENSAKEYCSEDISKIENYWLADLDNTQMWHCHHRGEILPCGIYTSADLKKFGLYYNRPAAELIFLTPYDHRSLHSKNLSLKSQQKRKSKLKGMLMWNNGRYTIRAVQCPGPNWHRGGLRHRGYY